MLALALLLATPHGVYPQITNPRKGAWLYHACLADVQSQDDPSPHPVTTPPEAACINYIQGVVDAGGVYDAFCTGEATFGTMVRVYVAYMQRNPKVMDETRFAGVWLSLLDAYPCPKK